MDLSSVLFHLRFSIRNFLFSFKHTLLHKWSVQNVWIGFYFFFKFCFVSSWSSRLLGYRPATKIINKISTRWKHTISKLKTQIEKEIWRKFIPYFKTFRALSIESVLSSIMIPKSYYAQNYSKCSTIQVTSIDWQNTNEWMNEFTEFPYFLTI